MRIEEGAAMTTITKLALGMMGKLRPQPALGACATSIALPRPQHDGGLSLMQALAPDWTVALPSRPEVMQSAFTGSARCASGQCVAVSCRAASFNADCTISSMLGW